MTSTMAGFDAAENTNEAPVGPVVRSKKRRRSRLVAGAILALAMVMGSFAIGAPSADATILNITPPVTNCADNACAARAGEAAIREYFGNQGTGSGIGTVGVVGCEQRNNWCIIRYFQVTVELDNGEAVLVSTRVLWTAVESCGDMGGLD